MKPVKQTFGSLFLVAVMVISIFCGGFSQTVLAETITITTKFTVKNAEIYRVITKDKGGGVYEVIEKGPMESGVPIQIRYDSSESIIVSYFAKPDPGYLITGTGASGEGNMSLVSELHDPEKKKKRTEGKVPEDVLTELEQNGYIIAWGYTKSSGNRSDITSSVVGYRPTVNSTITNTSGDIEPGKPITMEVIIRPASAFQGAGDSRKYETSIPKGGATVTIDGKKVIPVTDIDKENENLYKGTITFELGDDDASVNTHTAVVNASVDYKMQLAMNTGNYKSDVPVTTTTTVDAKPATVSFNLVTNTNRKLTYDLGYEGAQTFPVEIYNSGDTVTVKPERYERAESEFGGWFMTNNAGEVVTLQPSQTFSMPDRVTGTRLLAKWNSMLTVDNDNGTAVTKNIRESGSTVTPVKPTKGKYVFLGWKDSDGKTYGADDEVIMPNKPMKLLAMWYNPSPGFSAVIPSIPSTPNKSISGDNGIDSKEDSSSEINKETTANKVDKKNTSVEKLAPKTSSQNKSNKKNTSDTKAEKKAAASKSDKKASESKAENKKTSEIKPENKKTSESKSEKKTTESKTESKKSSESKPGKKTSESKAENKKSTESKSEKKTTESKTEKKKTSES